MDKPPWFSKKVKKKVVGSLAQPWDRTFLRERYPIWTLLTI